MFKKQQRLQGKEVRFLTKKRQVFARWLFTIFFVEQYPNRSFHQLSFHIPLLVSKRAVVRHKIKRILIQSFEQLLPSLDFGGKFYKCFITLHKMKLDLLQKLLQEKSDIKLKAYLQDQQIQTFNSFAQFLWKKTQLKNLHSSAKNH